VLYYQCSTDDIPVLTQMSAQPAGHTDICQRMQSP